MRVYKTHSCATLLFLLPALWLGTGQAARQSLDGFQAVQDDREPALISIAAMFAPMTDKTQWIKYACAGMTARGCEDFKSHADTLWYTHAGNGGSAVISGNVEVTVINGTRQFWHVPVAPGKSSEYTSVYVFAERGADGKWYLDQVVQGLGF